MTRTEELMKLVEAATPGPWDWPNVGSGDFVIAGKDKLAVGFLDSPRTAKYVAAANPETIKQLVELAVLQHEALKTCLSMSDHNNDGISGKACDEAIAEFERFEQGGE